MNYEYKKITDLKQIYDYYNRIKNAVPYWFNVDCNLWLESYQNDTDYDGEKMFSELVNYAAYAENEIVGFVQFGISNYTYNQNGEKDYSEKWGVIRNLYFDKEHNCGELLISLAESYFSEKNISKKSAFFHALGMTCNAGHGKLFCGLPHIETALLKFGYEKEHENVYYKRLLTGNDFVSDTVSVEYGEINPKGLQEFSIKADGKDVGAGALVYLPQGEICYLKWIYIYDTEQGKGYATSALKSIFSDLYEKGIRRLDTDTADCNIIAQKLYEKVGFADMGRTRSYHRCNMYSGLIIKESLTDECILDSVEIKGVDIWKTDNTPKYWTAITFSSNVEEFPEKLSMALAFSSENGMIWYVDFQSKEYKYIVLKDTVLKYRHGNNEEKNSVCKRCIELGVKKEQLDWAD